MMATPCPAQRQDYAMRVVENAVRQLRQRSEALGVHGGYQVAQGLRGRGRHTMVLEESQNDGFY
jgi:hypothetical protein